MDTGSRSRHERRSTAAIALTMVTAAALLSPGSSPADAGSSNQILDRTAFANDVGPMDDLTAAAESGSWALTLTLRESDARIVHDSTTGMTLDESTADRTRRRWSAGTEYDWAPWAASTSAESAAAMRAIGVSHKHWVVVPLTRPVETTTPSTVITAASIDDPYSDVGAAVLRTRRPDGSTTWMFTLAEPDGVAPMEARVLASDVHGRFRSLSATLQLRQIDAIYGNGTMTRVPVPASTDTVTLKAFRTGLDVVRAPAMLRPAADAAAAAARSASSHKVAALRAALRREASRIHPYVLKVHVADVRNGARIYETNPYSGVKAGWQVTYRSGKVTVRAL